MKLSKQQIEHITNLARLRITDNEKKLYAEQLSRVLEYFEQLKEVDTENIDPTAQVTGLVNVLREDKIKEWDTGERDQSLKQAPDLEDRQIRVKRVIQ